MTPAIIAAGGRAISVCVDVSDAAQVHDMVGAALDAYGGIDILFNAAGVLAFGSVLDTDERTWRRVMDVNLNGTYLCCRAVIPQMIERGGGAIVNTSSSTGAHDANADAAAYVTSKGGVTLLTRCMAIDHARHNIRVNAIAPGPTDTPMLRSNMTPEALAAFAATYPMGRLGRPEELARAALFLASEEASFVTGAILCVDGGQTALV
jgi:meso-butanediol dehydrogenase/(S,S)-butanediol dehydrogenase/diacetyl reductase